MFSFNFVTPKKLLLFLSFFVYLFLAVTSAYAALVIEPANIKLNLNGKRASGTFVLKNVGDTEERYRAKSTHFIITSKGVLKEVPADDYSLAAWIKFNPQEFVLPPNTSRAVRYSVIPQGKVKTREYWGAIQFMPLQAATISSNVTEGRSLSLKVLTVVLVPIYGFVEGTAYSGQIKQFELGKDKENKEQLYLNCVIVNTGEGVLRLGGDCEIFDSAGKNADKINIIRTVIYPKTEQTIKLKLKPSLVPGKYRARVKLKYTDSESKMELSRDYQLDL